MDRYYLLDRRNDDNAANTSLYHLSISKTMVDYKQQ